MDMNQWIDAELWVTYEGSSDMHDFGLNAENKEDMEPLFVEEGKQFGDGATYLLPFAGDILLMYYNATMFDENDLETAPSLSWETLLENCRQIKEIDPDSIPLAINQVDATFLSLCAQYGVSFTGEDWKAVFGEEGRMIAKELNAMYQKGYLTTAGLQGTALDLDDSTEKPRHYVVIDYCSNAPEQIPSLINEAYEYEADVMTMSRLAGETPKVFSRSSGIAICQTEDEELATAAWLLAKFMSVESTFQGGLAKDTATIPTVKSAWMDEEFGQYLNESNGGSGLAGLVGLMAQDQENYRFTVSSFAGSAEIRAQLTSLIEKCLTFTGDVDAQIAEAFEAALAACAK
jgi:ABC-type glycerol-3-phosphate transport system substrate-binding protein